MKYFIHSLMNNKALWSCEYVAIATIVSRDIDCPMAMHGMNTVYIIIINQVIVLARDNIAQLLFTAMKERLQLK